MFLSSCMYEKGEVQTWAAAVKPPLPCPHLSLPTAFFLLVPRQRLMTLQSGLGPISPALSHSPLSLSLYKWRLSVFIVQRVTRQPADGGLPWPRWTSGASFRNRRSLARSVTHCHTGRVHHTITAEVFCCVRMFLFVWQISPHCCEVFIKSKTAWIGSCMLMENILFQVKCRLLKNVRTENNYSERWIVCLMLAHSCWCWLLHCSDVIQITSFTYLYQK